MTDDLMTRLREVREKLAQLADKQADQRGDYLYRGQPDSALLFAIREIDAALAHQDSSREERHGD